MKSKCFFVLRFFLEIPTKWITIHGYNVTNCKAVYGFYLHFTTGG